MKKTTINKRQRIIKLYSKGNSIQKISQKCSTSLKVIKNTIKCQNYYSNIPLDSSKRVRLFFKDKEWLRIAEEAIYNHIKFLQSRGDTVYGSTIKHLARQVATDYKKSFNASNGWLENFKRRFGFNLPLFPMNSIK